MPKYTRNGITLNSKKELSPEQLEEAFGIVDRENEPKPEENNPVQDILEGTPLAPLAHPVDSFNALKEAGSRQPSEFEYALPAGASLAGRTIKRIYDSMSGNSEKYFTKMFESNDRNDDFETLSRGIQGLLASTPVMDAAVDTADKAVMEDDRHAGYKLFGNVLTSVLPFGGEIAKDVGAPVLRGAGKVIKHPATRMVAAGGATLAGGGRAIDAAEAALLASGRMGRIWKALSKADEPVVPPSSGELPPVEIPSVEAPSVPKPKNKIGFNPEDYIDVSDSIEVTPESFTPPKPKRNRVMNTRNIQADVTDSIQVDDIVPNSPTSNPVSNQAKLEDVVPVKKVSLYRGEGDESRGGQFFTPNRKLAELYAKDRTNPSISKIDIPEEQLSSFLPENPEYIVPPGQEMQLGEYKLPSKLSSSATPDVFPAFDDAVNEQINIINDITSKSPQAMISPTGGRMGTRASGTNPRALGTNPRALAADPSVMKARGMQAAAKQRAKTGNLTGREAQIASNRAESNFIGKPVNTPDGPGKISGNSFGRIKVDLDSGTTASYSFDEITPGEGYVETSLQQKGINPRALADKRRQP